METVNIHQAKTRLSELIARVEEGEEFVIARAGKPIARLSKLTRPPRREGFLQGQIVLDGAFDEADEEIKKMFDESEIFPE